MRRIAKALMVLMVAGLVMFVGTGVALAAVVVHSGVMTISVHDRSADGVNFYLPVPAALINVVSGSLPLFMPEQQLAEMRRKVGPWQQPVLEALEAFADSPDAVLVTVESKRERVRIEKNGRSLQITVHDTDSDIQISLPISSLHRLIDSLA